jgi:hypothetical protein
MPGTYLKTPSSFDVGWTTMTARRAPMIEFNLEGRRALDVLGGLDYLVNNAGAPFTRAPIPPSAWIAAGYSAARHKVAGG